ncbi:flavodoxin-like domain-containing protein, partial [Haematococcus lacustris]
MDMQAPVEAVLVDSVTVQDLASGVKVLRGLCSNKLRMEVEYMLKHGTSDNSYLIS